MAKPSYPVPDQNQHAETNRALVYEKRLKEAKKQAKIERFWPWFRCYRTNEAVFLKMLQDKKERLPETLRKGIEKWNKRQLVPLVRLLSFLLGRHHKVLEKSDNWFLILQIAQHLDRAVRPLEDFSFRSRSSDQVFKALLKHLFERYATPDFLRNAFGQQHEQQDWYLLWGSGHSPRTFPNAPMVISKRMAHNLQFAPKESSIMQALLWAQAKAIGIEGSVALPYIVQAAAQVPYLNKKIKHIANDHPAHPIRFWESFVRFIVLHNSVIMPNSYGILVDYVFAMKYQYLGRTLQLKDVNYSLKGRSASTLMRQVAEWHDELRSRKLMKQLPAFWDRVDIQNFNHTVGFGDHKIYYSIKQLTQQSEVYLEGKRMHHCVFSYIPACVSGDSSIWKMEMDNDLIGRSGILTIEVHNRSRTIVQARGKQNRIATAEERKIIQKWATQNDLTVNYS